MNYLKTISIAIGMAFLAGTGCSTFSKGVSGWSLDKLLAMGKPDSGGALADDDYDAFGEKKPDRLMLMDLGPGRIGTTLKSRFAGGKNQTRAESNFRQARELYQQANTRFENGQRDGETEDLFRQAAEKFEIAAAAWPGSALEQDALFMQGESSFFANDYVLANRAYEILLSRYSGSPQLDLVESRRFEIAQYWLALARKGAGIRFGDPARPNTGLVSSARRILHRIRLDDPTGKLADDATLALGNAFFEDGQFSDAADAYEDLRRTFPGSPHQFHAHLFELKARLAAYRGPSFDGTDLEKAEKLMQTLVRQFPGEVEAEREYLAGEGQRIRELLAERDWTVGKYYEARGENRAARFYYARVAEGYEDTSLGGQARERIAALGGLPEVPEQKVPWLAELFPVKERNKPLITAGNRESILR